MTHPTLELRNIWKIFGLPKGHQNLSADEAARIADDPSSKYVAGLRDVSVEVRPKETFVLMGLSGSGKSTLMRCMSRLTEITSGEVLMEGQDLLAIPPKELVQIRRQKMGMVFQSFALLPYLTVLENIAFPLRIQKMSRRERDARAQELAEMVGLSGREHNYPHELSGGQQQRVGIARSLAGKPEIWFLDEPFSALDPIIRREMQDEVIRLREKLGKTIVFVTHDFDEAIRLADRIAILRNGMVEQIGTPEEILANPATDYVEAFTKDAPLGKVLSARSIMSDPGEPGADDPRISASARVSELAFEMFDLDKKLTVYDDDGNAIGQVNGNDVLRTLTNTKESAPKPANEG